MSDVTRITGVSRPRMEQWMQLGYIKPSVNRASGRGTRNIFDRYDLYKIALFRHITETGWYREDAGRLLRALDDDTITSLIWGWQYKQFQPLREDILFGNFSDELLEKGLAIDKTSRFADLISEKVRKEFIKCLDEKLGDIGLYLVFCRVIHPNPEESFIGCYPVIEDKEIIVNGKPIALQLSTLKKHFGTVDDVYMINFSTIAKNVDKALYRLYPGKIEQHVEELQQSVEDKRNGPRKVEISEDK